MKYGDDPLLNVRDNAAEELQLRMQRTGRINVRRFLDLASDLAEEYAAHLDEGTLFEIGRRHPYLRNRSGGSGLPPEEKPPRPEVDDDFYPGPREEVLYHNVRQFLEAELQTHVRNHLDGECEAVIEVKPHSIRLVEWRKHHYPDGDESIHTPFARMCRAQDDRYYA